MHRTGPFAVKCYGRAIKYLCWNFPFTSNMIFLPLLTLIAYSFPVDTHLTYSVKVDFDGYLPLLRGRNALASLTMAVDVFGAPPADNNPRVVSELKTAKMTLNGGTLPVSKDNLEKWFPRTTIEATPEGKQLKSDAPDVKLPVRLPGLDVKRFPDITYLPIEFPKGGIEEGKAFKFQKLFGDSPVTYEVTPTKISPNTVDLTIKLSQNSVTFEDDHRAPTEEASAVTKVTTELSGEGTAEFDLKRGLVTSLSIEAHSVGQAIDLKTKTEIDRKLKTTLTVSLMKP